MMQDAVPGDVHLQERALVIVEDDRIALATALVLQEMNHSVEISLSGTRALEWLRRERYDIIVCGPGGDDVRQAALRLRRSAPTTRVVLLVRDELESAHAAELARSSVEIMAPPLNVNALVRRFWPAAA